MSLRWYRSGRSHDGQTRLGGRSGGVACSNQRCALDRTLPRCRSERAGVLAAYSWCSAAVVALAVARVRCDSLEGASRCRIWLNSASSVARLTRQASAPAARARSNCARSFLVVTTRIGTLRVVESRRRSSHSAWPSKNGRWISVITSAGWYVNAFTSASRLSNASTTSHPICCSDRAAATS